MSNIDLSSGLPPLPSYNLTPRPSIIPGVSDLVLQLLLPVVVYWIVSLGFHFLDSYEIWSQYRLHTPAEVLKRNHVKRYEVVRDVIIQQIIQTAFGLVIGQLDPVEMIGKQDYDIAVWARRIRGAQRYLPRVLALLGVDSVKLGHSLLGTAPSVAVLLSGRYYSTPDLGQGRSATTPDFAAWELLAAKAMYWALIPALQFAAAMALVDTSQYFVHRALHMNNWLYTTLHSRHHRLYVPYAFGALYNHPGEALLDSLGSGIAYLVVGMTVRQGMWFFTFSTIKTVDDHCGYAFPWDPLQHLTSNNAAYHDVHHQSWGIKTNFSQPFTTFWDRVLGTTWTGGDVSARYERSRIAAQMKVKADLSAKESSVTNSPAVDISKASRQAAASQAQVLHDNRNGGPHIIQEECGEEKEARHTAGLGVPARRKTGSLDPKGDGLRNLREMVAGILHGRSSAILHADGGH